MLTHSYAPTGTSRSREGYGYAKCFVLAALLIVGALALVFLPDWRRQTTTELDVIKILAMTPTAVNKIYQNGCKETPFAADHSKECTELLASGIQETWTALGPVDLKKYISIGKIRFDDSFDVGILKLAGIFYQG